MKNTEVQKNLDECEADLNSVILIINGLGQTSNIVPYLTKYSIIRACGAIETSFKSIIADHCSKRSKKQLKQYLTKKVRDNSCNPSYDNICNMLNDFDSKWKDAFKSKIKAHTDGTQIRTSLQSLVDARNEFSHGGNPGSSISDTFDYFKHCRIVIEILDDVIS